MTKAFVTLSPEEFRALVEISLAKEDFIRVSNLVSLPNCPPDILTYFARDYAAQLKNPADPSLRSYIKRNIISISRRNPNLPLEIIQKYFDTLSFTNDGIRELYGLMSNLSITEEMFRGLYLKAKALGAENKVIYSMFGHINCPMELLEDRVKSAKKYERSAVAHHPRITSKMIQELLNDDFLYNRVILAKNPSVPLQVFDKMIAKGCNPKNKEKIDPQILQALIKRSAPGERREELITLLLNRTKNARARLIATEFTQNPDIAAKGCYDKAVKVRKRAIKNPVTPTSAIVVATLMGK